MRRINKIIIAVILVAVMLLGIGYAAIQNITLNITGTATADPSQANFTVKFSGTPTTDKTNVSENSTEAKVTAAITDDTNATINVEGLTAKGDVVTATYTVQNTSADLSADLTVETTNNNKEYFTITSELGKTSLTATEATTLTVTVELIKTPITAPEEATIGIQLTAAPVQPGEEGSTNTGSGTGGSTGGTEDDDANTDVGANTEPGPYLPTGFSWANTEHTEIKDSSNNQYVWVSVPRDATVYNDLTDATEDDLYGDGNYVDATNEDILAFDVNNLTADNLTAIETELKEYTATYRKSGYTDEFYSTAQHGFADADAYNEHKNKMLASVFKNGGFYVGKYETGIADTNADVVEARTDQNQAIADYTPVIQANAYPYNFVTNKQAQELASGMASGEYTSSLMFGLQWDLVLKHLQVSNKAEIDELNSDSTEWGNYSNNNWTIENTDSKYYYNSSWTDGLYNGTGAKGNTTTSILLSTGASDDFEKGGIYDLAGNVFECTLEYTSDTGNPCAFRGGCYLFSGSSSPASFRKGNITTVASSVVGFRVSLF